MWYIFLDFAKAFDTVDHKILINKLEYYGIRGLPLKLMKSYLNNRQQCVKIGNTQSDFLTIKCGVPQGSVLGPLLFLLYINDIQKSSRILKFILFADDTSVLHSLKNTLLLEQEINEGLEEVTQWLNANKLSLNLDKTNLYFYQNKVLARYF